MFIENLKADAFSQITGSWTNTEKTKSSDRNLICNRCGRIWMKFRKLIIHITRIRVAFLPNFPSGVVFQNGSAADCATLIHKSSDRIKSNDRFSRTKAFLCLAEKEVSHARSFREFTFSLNEQTVSFVHTPNWYRCCTFGKFLHELFIFGEFFEIKGKYVNDSSSNENARRCSKIEFLNYFHRHWPYLRSLFLPPVAGWLRIVGAEWPLIDLMENSSFLLFFRPLILFLSMFCSMPFRYLQSLCVSVGTHAKSGSFHTWIWIFRRSWIFIKLIYRQSPFFPSARFF